MTDRVADKSKTARNFRFGAFRYLPHLQSLYGPEGATMLGGPESALLEALLEKAGEFVDKDELVSRMWPGRIVSESNLRWQVGVLRRRLGCTPAERLIITSSGRGYRFVAPVTLEAGTRPGSDPWREPDLQAAPFPTPRERIRGREREMVRIFQVLQTRPLVTIAGPGGIGKTTLAIAVAAQSEAESPGRTVFVDLAGVRTGGDAALAFARALGLSPLGGAMSDAIAVHLRDRRLLLLLDSCEGAREEIADLAAMLLRSAPGVAILSTSQEPLECAGEHVIRLGPLELPPEGLAVTAATLARYSATALFLDQMGRVEAANLGEEALPISGEHAEQIADVCRRLEGYPLAIELAAGQVSSIGLQDLASFLSDGFLLSMAGTGDRAGRHRTLARTFAWSYDRLSSAEQVLLRQMSVVEGRFSLLAARHIAAGPALTGHSVAHLLAALVRKSWVTALDVDSDCRFRLLEPVRAYAQERLAQAGETPGARERHARVVLALLSREESVRPAIGDRRNLAVALDWAYETEGKLPLAIDLTLAGAVLWNENSLVAESVARTRQALAAARRIGAGEKVEQALRVELVGGLVASGGRGPQLVEASNALIGHASVADGAALLTGRWGLWVDRISNGDAVGAMRHAEAFDAQARAMSDLRAAATSDRIMGMSLHLAGDQAAAIERLDRTLPAFAWPERSRANLPYRFDQRIMVLACRARALLLTGRCDEALQTAKTAADEAVEMRHRSSLAVALTIGYFPVALLLGDMTLASDVAARIETVAGESGLPDWQAIAAGFRGWLNAAAGECNMTSINRTLATIHAVPFGPTFPLALCDLARAALLARHPEAARAIVVSALVGVERSGARWCEPELLRVKAAIERESSALDARYLLECADTLAEQQGALFWRGRIASDGYLPA